MNLSPRNRLIAVAAVALLVVVALAAVLVLPQIKKLAVVSVQIEKAIDESDAAKVLLEQRREIKNRAVATDARLIQLAVAIPENPDLPSLIIDLQDTAYDAGVVIMNVQPGTPEVAGHIGLPVSMEVWGTWSDTVDFLQRLSKVDRELRTEGFNADIMSPTSPDAEEGNEAGLSFPPYYQVRSTIRVSAYAIPAVDANAAAPAAPAPAP